MPKTLINGSFVDANGTAVANGTLVLTLSQDAQIIAGGNVDARNLIAITLDSNGDVTGSPSVYGQDELNPGNTYYFAEVLNSGGSSVWGPTKWVFTGASPINLDLMVPTLLNPDPAYSQPVLMNPTGDQVIQNNSLSPATGNTTQSLGKAAAPWDAALQDVVVQSSLVFGTSSAVSRIVLSGASDPYGGSIQTAINALQTNGGVIDATAVGVASVSQGTIDPAAKSVTILLGPYTYNVSQVTLRTNTHIIGSGSGAGLSSSKPPTTINSIGSNATPLFIIGQTASEGQEGIVVRGLRCTGAAGNTSQVCFNISAPANGGLWYSEFDDLELSGFAGEIIQLFGPNGGGINQFSTFKRIVAFRTTAGGLALHIKGFNNSLKFENCQLDGQSGVSGGDGLTNIKIEDISGGVFPPYNIKFDLLTTQWAGVGVQLNGCDAVSFDQLHMEGVFGAIAVGTGASFGSFFTVHDSWFGNGTGINTGSGYIINVTGAAANVAGEIINSRVFAAPDAFLLGNTGSMASFGNTIGPEGSFTYQPPRSPLAMPQMVAVVDLTAQTAAVAATTIFTPSASGLYRILAYLKVTTAAGTSSTLGAVTITFTDATDSVAQSQVMQMETEAGAAATTNAGNATSSKLSGNLIINAKTGVAVQYAIAYASNAASAMNYEVHLKAELLF